MTGGKHSQLASASLPANVSPGSLGSNRSTEPRFVIQVKVGRSSRSVGQLSEVQPAEAEQVSPGFTTDRFTRYSGRRNKANESIRQTLASVG